MYCSNWHSQVPYRLLFKSRHRTNKSSQFSYTAPDFYSISGGAECECTMYASHHRAPAAGKGVQHGGNPGRTGSGPAARCLARQKTIHVPGLTKYTPRLTQGGPAGPGGDFLPLIDHVYAVARLDSVSACQLAGPTWMR